MASGGKSRLENYRKAQLINGILGDAFGDYMEWFPSILLGIFVLNLFAALRFTHLSWYIYLMAPACGVRCLFESLSVLQFAGHVNQTSINTLRVWRTPERTEGKFIRAFHKSCRVIVCSAGSLYTFESSIVLVNVDLSIQAVVNLLLMTKNFR